MPRYELIPHTADIGVRVYGANLKELFENAAFAMFDIIADLDGLKGTATQDIKVKAPNSEELLVAWLDELLYNFYTKQVIFYDFNITEITGEALAGKAHGRHIGENKNRLKTEIKAVTYHELKIEEAKGIYTVTIIFDV